MNKYRVIQYATGGVGRHAIRALADHPAMELVGLLVHSKDKAGRDAGELAGIAPLGVTATDDIEAIVAMEADCVSYMALWPDIDLICRLLESGKNVVTTSGLLYPKFFGPELVERLEAACRKGGTSVHGTGINPGFSGEVLPLTMSVLNRRIEQIYVREYADFHTYNSPEMNHDMLGFGRTVEDFKANPHSEAHNMRRFFYQSIQMVADGLAAELDGIEEVEEYGIARHDTRIESGPIPAGTIGGLRIRMSGIVGGKPRIVIELNWLATRDLGPGWAPPQLDNDHTQWSVTIEGEPSLRCTFEQAATFAAGGGGDHTEPAMICTTMHAINAIPYVCEATPGIKTFLNLPLMAGQHTLR